jgi:RNA polymerase sigma-70 factor (ECF subfamily)
MHHEDAELVSRSKQGDLQAFNLIVERYQAQVYNLAARILGDLTSAEDVAQDTFISAHRAMGQFRGGSLRAWLLRIAANRSRDFIRASRRRPEQSLDQALLNPRFSVRSREPSPEQAAISGELGAEIQRAILSLPMDQRTTMVLVDVQGLSYEEASEATGAAIGTVKSRLSRARSGLRDFLLRNRELLPEQFRQIHRRGKLQ